MIPLVYGLVALTWNVLLFAAGIGVGRQWEKERRARKQARRAA